MWFVTIQTLVHAALGWGRDRVGWGGVCLSKESNCIVQINWSSTIVENVIDRIRNYYYDLCGADVHPASVMQLSAGTDICGEFPADAEICGELQ